MFNLYIYLLSTFLKITTGEIFKQYQKRIRLMKKRKQNQQKKQIKEVSYSKILLAFIFK
jgi:AraC-like DNA-binding protein